LRRHGLPVLCKLSDFGEARSRACKTRMTATTTRTRNVARGSLVYRAPESFGTTEGVGIADLKAMDLWSLAMIIFELLNPNTYAYEQEIANAPQSTSEDAIVQQAHERKKLPAFHSQYAAEQQSAWKPLRAVYDCVAVYNAASSPSVDELVQMLTTEHVYVQKLPLSQTYVSSLFVRPDKPLPQTENACTFIAVLVGDKAMKMSYVRSVSIDDLCSITTDTVLNFPPDVNRLRNKTEMYAVYDAYRILRSVRACDCYEIKFAVVATGMTPVSTAKSELRMALSEQLQKHEQFYAVYTVPPYSVLLICKTAVSSLTVVDTNAVSSELKGDCKNGDIVHSRCPANALAAISNWIFSRLFRTALMFQHELAILTPQLSSASPSEPACQQQQELTVAPDVSTVADGTLPVCVRPKSLTQPQHVMLKPAQAVRVTVAARPTAVVHPTSAVTWHQYVPPVESACSVASSQPDSPQSPAVLSFSTTADSLNSATETLFMSCADEAVVHVCLLG